MHNEDAAEILREFVADVMAAHGGDYNRACAELGADWLDLAIMFQRAYALCDTIDRGVRVVFSGE